MARPKEKATKKRRVRARVRGDGLELLDPIPFREGDEIVVSISEPVPTRNIDALHRAAGTWRGLVNADALIMDIYADRLITTRSLPHV